MGTNTESPEVWTHDPQRDGAGCSWCGAWAQVDADNLCRECFAEDAGDGYIPPAGDLDLEAYFRHDDGRATLTSTILLAGVSATLLAFIGSFVSHAAAMFGGLS